LEPDNKLSWLKITWPLWLLPFVIWAMSLLPAVVQTRGGKYAFWIPFLWILLGILAILLLLFTLKFIRDNKKRK